MPLLLLRRGGNEASSKIPQVVPITLKRSHHPDLTVFRVFPFHHLSTPNGILSFHRYLNRYASHHGQCTVRCISLFSSHYDDDRAVVSLLLLLRPIPHSDISTTQPYDWERYEKSAIRILSCAEQKLMKRETADKTDSMCHTNDTSISVSVL